jgi:parallel beta-helix repeat protein
MVKKGEFVLIKLLLFTVVNILFVLSLGFASASTPGNISSCQTLDTAGNYFLNMSLINENVTSTGCFRISASNVVLDCQNYYIKNESLRQIGIEAYDSENVTIKNCNVSMNSTLQGYGFVFTRQNNSFIFNSIANNNAYGIYLSGGVNNILSNITANGNRVSGVWLSESNNNTLSNVTSNSNTNGFYISSSSGNSLVGINANNNTQGISLSGASGTMNNNQIINSTITNNAQYGIYGSLFGNNTRVTNTIIENNRGYGIECYTDAVGSTVYFNSNTFNNNVYAVRFFGRDIDNDYAVFSNNIFNNNTQGIISYLNSGLLELNNNTFFNTSVVGSSISVGGSRNIVNANNLIDGRAVYYNESISNQTYNLTNSPNAGTVWCLSCNNITIRDLNLNADDFGSGIYFSSTNNSFIYNVSVIGKKSSGENGISFVNSFSNTAVNVNVYNISDYGFYLYSRSMNNLFLNSTFHNSNLTSSVGIYIEASRNNTFYSMLINNSYNGLFVQSYASFNSTNNTFAKNVFLNSNNLDIYFDVDSYPNYLCGNNYSSLVNDSGGAQEELVPCPDYNITAILLSHGIYISSSSNNQNNNQQSSSSSSGGGGGGGGGASSSTYTLDEKDFNEGEQRALAINDQFKFSVSGEEHRVKLIDLNTNSVMLNISSKSQIASLVVGETKKFDINEDGNIDLSVTLHSIGIKNGQAVNASIEIKKDSGVLQGSTPNVTGSTEKEERVVSSPKANNAIQKSSGNLMNVIWVVLLIGIIVLVVIIIIVRKKNDLSKKVKIREGKQFTVK